MQSVTYSDARNHLATLLDKAINEHQPVTITRKNGKNAVLISLDDYTALQHKADSGFDLESWLREELDRIEREDRGR